MKTAGKFRFHKVERLKGLKLLWIHLYNFKQYLLPHACNQYSVVAFYSLITAHLSTHLCVGVRLPRNLVRGGHRTMISQLQKAIVKHKSVVLGKKKVIGRISNVELKARGNTKMSGGNVVPLTATGWQHGYRWSSWSSCTNPLHNPAVSRVGVLDLCIHPKANFGNRIILS